MRNRVEGDVHESALTDLRGSWSAFDGGFFTFGGDEPQAAASFGDDHVAIGEPGNAPGAIETGDDGGLGPTSGLTRRRTLRSRGLRGGRRGEGGVWLCAVCAGDDGV